MARYQVILSYDGTNFIGSQRQDADHQSHGRSRTVQGELERALTKLGWSGQSVLMAGRTDTGVHASGQVAAFDYEWNHSLYKLISAINSKLPSDMAVDAAKVVDDNFHPRFDATSRRYCYRLFFQQFRNPLRERYAWRLWPDIQLDVLQAAANCLIGKNDFSAFGSPPKKGTSTVRTVLKAEWQQQGNELTFNVQADGFLYRMVRKMVHVQVAISQGRSSMQVIDDAFNGKPQGILPGLAPAKGLTLVEVTYPVVDNLLQVSATE